MYRIDDIANLISSIYELAMSVLDIERESLQRKRSRNKTSLTNDILILQENKLYQFEQLHSKSAN